MNVIKNCLLHNTRIVLRQVFMTCILILLLAGQIGCVAPMVGQGYQTVPILYGILTENRSASGIPEYRLATAQEWQQVRVLRSDSRLNTIPRMPLNIGDEVWTGPNSAVAIRFPNGSQLYLRSNSHIKIGSVFTFFGELFVSVRGAFQVDTEFVTAGAEGTEWVMLVSPNGDTRSMVLGGRVRVASRKNFWRPMLMTENNQVVTRDSRSVETMLATQEELNEMRYWINQIDQLVREPQLQPPTNSNPFPGIFLKFPFNINPGIHPGRDSGSNENYPDSNNHQPNPSPNSGDIIRRSYPNIRQDTIRRDDVIR